MSDCPICLEKLKFNNRMIHETSCGHKFHKMCFKKVKSNTCPCCRGDVLQDVCTVISNLRSEIKDLKFQQKSDNKLVGNILSDSKKELALLKKELGYANNILNSGAQPEYVRGLQIDKIEKI